MGQKPGNSELQKAKVQFLGKLCREQRMRTIAEHLVSLFGFFEPPCSLGSVKV